MMTGMIIIIMLLLLLFSSSSSLSCFGFKRQNIKTALMSIWLLWCYLVVTIVLLGGC